MTIIIILHVFSDERSKEWVDNTREKFCSTERRQRNIMKTVVTRSDDMAVEAQSNQWYRAVTTQSP
jgi:hypothetical protein